ncbi:hypothetical protein GpartN1_g1938.t1 [Galdieria partita]|uniref:Methyltransferase n=1 Tax=Galdieria partita TaxID=83374 RepID=A0A9C7UP51_9RHOD|nr:hypothetical protein GpartN1_g1923.t1 [Galdieria partita]GJQ10147.1 hypothetical protein GpartN1_g1938.t1 [Galdieria partita]
MDENLWEKVHAIQGWFNKETASQLYDILMKTDNDISQGEWVEIGSWMGRSTAFFALLLQKKYPGKILHAIDTFQGTPNDAFHEDTIRENHFDLYQEFQKNMNNLQLPIQIHKEKSVDCHWELPISLLYLDGDHDLYYMMEEFRKFDLFLHTGSFLIMDDVPSWIGPTHLAGHISSMNNYHKIWAGANTIVFQKI